jgi:hypothetical protein
LWKTKIEERQVQTNAEKEVGRREGRYGEEEKKEI